MKKHLAVAACLLVFLQGATWAQTPNADNADSAGDEAARARISATRGALDRRFATEEAACYRKFAVTDCVNDSRRRRRAEMDALKRQETAINDRDRQQRAAAQRQKLEEKKSPQRARDAAVKRDDAQGAQQGREQRAAEHAARRASSTRNEGAERREFEDKQRTHAEHQAQQASRRAEAPAERRAYEDKQQSAVEHRAEVEKNNAQRAKPRAAPLPPPPP